MLIEIIIVTILDGAILAFIWFYIMNLYGINDPKVSRSLKFLELRNTRLFRFTRERSCNQRHTDYTYYLDYVFQNSRTFHHILDFTKT